MSESSGTISVGLLAYGAIGDEHNRAIAATPGLRLVAVADTNPERLAAANGRSPCKVGRSSVDYLPFTELGHS